MSIFSVKALKRLRQKQRVQAAVQRLYETPDGKLLLDFIFDQTYVTKTLVTKNNDKELLWRESKRHLGLTLFHFLVDGDIEAQIQQLIKSTESNQEDYE